MCPIVSQSESPPSSTRESPTGSTQTSPLDARTLGAGALGGVLEEDRSRRRTEETIADPIPGTVPRTRRLVTVLLSLVAGLVTFFAVGIGLTEGLDPYIWPSALVGLPVGAILGVAVAVLGYHALTTRGRHQGDDGSSCAI